MPLAALDIGSNSFNLLIAEHNGSTIKQIARVKQKVQLGAGLDADNNLSQQAIDRGMQCLRDFLPLLNRHGVSKLFCAATNTIRVANNRNDFLHSAEALLMQPISVISGVQEAQYIYTAVHNEYRFAGTGLVLDIGGGSTEFAIGHDAEISPDNCHSIQVGCVSYSSHYFSDGKIYTENMSAAEASCRHELDNIATSIDPAKAEHLIGTSGTVQSIAMLLEELYDRDPRQISLNDLEQLKTELVAAGEVDALGVVSLEENRQKILPAGLTILIAIMRYWEIQQLEVAQTALCEGLLLENIKR